MNILSITLCNITALEGEHIIDFTAEPLRSAGLFAITGDTGAGKTSVLDAICLALYGKAPRLEGAERVKKDVLELAGADNSDLHPADARAFLRKGCKQGYAHLRFANAQGDIYEAQWKVRINSRGNLAATQQALYEVSPKGQLTLITDEKSKLKEHIVRIVGLDFAQFTRTVILAQNSFATFLQAKNQDKSELLEKLTGTEIYARISTQIFTFNKEAQAEVERIAARQQGALTWRLSQADVQEHTERMAHLDTTISNRLQLIEGIATALQWYADNQTAQQRLEEATAQHNEHNKNYLALQSEERWLERYDSVQPFRSLFEQIKEKRGVIERIKVEEQAKANAAEGERKQLKEAENLLIIARERRVDAEEQLRIKTADLNEGYAIEGEIKTLTDNSKEEELKWDKMKFRISELSSNFLQLQQEGDRLKKQYEGLNLRRQSLAIHQAMFDQFQAVNDKLQLYNTEATTNERAHLDYSNATLSQNQLSAQFDKAQKTLQDQRDRLATARANRKVHQQSIAELDPTQLHSQRSHAEQRLTRLQMASRLWNRIVEGYERVAETRAKLQRQSSQLAQKRSELALLEREDEQLHERFMRLNKAFTMSQIEEVKKLRASLKEGTPCPVCGSAHHPYHTEVEQESGETQSQLEKDYLEAERLYAAKHALVKELRQEISLRQGAQTTEEEGYVQLKRAQQQLEEDWQLCAPLDSSFAECTPTVNREGRSTTIDMLIDATQRQLDDIEARIKKFDHHNAQLQTIDQEVGRWENELEEQEKHHNALDVKLQLIRERVESTHRTMVESDARIEQLYKDLDDVVTVSGWRDDNLDDFAKRIAVLHADWRSVNAQLADNEKERALNQVRLESLDKQLDEERSEEAQQRERCARLQEITKGKQEEMHRLFGNSTPALLAQTLQNNIDQAAQHCQRLIDNREAISLRLQHLEGERTNLIHTRQQQEEETRLRSTALDHAIARYNLEHAPLQASELAQLFEDTRNVKTLRQKIEGCKRDLLLASQTKEQAQQEYMALQSQPTRPSEREEDRPEALQSHQEQLREEVKELQAERGKYAHALMRHHDSMQQAQVIEEQLEKARLNAEEWARLNMVFGSADGKKFRDMAQSYTFAALVEHANYHLRQLSPRYELQVLKGSLTLEVVDHDMLDERRYVTSLSGGETFIVSLALALGLASLSNTTFSIGALFIDEGFGNLDQDSLAQVLDTLSALERNQGRKVGIVSHTEQIRTQIAPQIQLVKLGNEGRSMVRVV